MRTHILALAGALSLACAVPVHPATASARHAADLSEARASHSATLLPDGSVLIAGGFRKGADGMSQLYARTTERYLPRTGGFVPAAAMTEARAGHVAAVLAGGRVLLAGGWGPRGMLRSAELYDPARDAFAATGAMTEARGGFTATALADGRVLIAGGGDDTATATAELYDPRTGTFAPTGSMRSPRLGHTATLLDDGRVLVAGGESARGAVLATAELYDPRTGTFEPTGDMAEVRYKHGAIRLDDGSVLIVGGSDDADWRGERDTAERWDPATGRFAAPLALGHARFKMPEALVRLADGRILVAGGAAVTEIYEPAHARFRDAAALPAPLYYASATPLAGGDVLIVGGYDRDIHVHREAWRLSLAP